MKVNERRPTMRDVARAAGVSHMTVSRVVNGDRAVKPETREAVEQAIGRLGFQPNQAARALSNAVAAQIALLHHFPNPGSLGEYLVHLMQASTRAHANLIVRDVTTEDRRATVMELVERGVRGVILAPPMGDDQALIEHLRDAGIAIVVTGSTYRTAGLASVGIDDRAAARAMTEHLIALGHRRIGLIAGRRNHASSAFRLAGYAEALAAAGIAADPQLVVEGNYTYQSGLEAAERLLRLDSPPTAIFASNDDMAAATVAVAHRRGIEVPAQLSVCGFDDTPLATTIWPELTTIRQPVQAVTQTAFEMMLQALAAPDAKEEPPHVRLIHELIRRQSDGPPP